MKNRKKTSTAVADAYLINRFSETPGVWITFAGSAFYNFYYEKLETIDLKPSLVTALAFIEQFEGITQSELGRKMKINRASAMSISNALSDLNLITRSQLARLNQIALEITPLGIQNLTEACAIEQEISAEVLPEMDEEKKAEFLQTLKIVTAKINSLVPN